MFCCSTFLRRALMFVLRRHRQALGQLKKEVVACCFNGIAYPLTSTGIIPFQDKNDGTPLFRNTCCLLATANFFNQYHSHSSQTGI